MLSTFIIVFREILEAMLVVGIASAAARQTGISMRWVYGGLASGLMAAGIIALCANIIASAASGMGQEIFQATVLLSAALLMLWTTIWMNKHGKQTAARIQQACQADTHSPSQRMSTRSAAVLVATIVALAVSREGAEIVLFLHGVAAGNHAGSAAMYSGAALGALLGGGFAVMLYHGVQYIPLRHLFGSISLLMILLAAGMAAQATAFLVMIDVLPALVQPLWDSSGILAANSMVGELLHALMGYDDRPSAMQVLAFVLFVSGGWAMLQLQKKAPQCPTRRPRTACSAAVMLLAAVLALTLHAEHAEAKKVYSPIVEQGEVELEYLLDYSIDADPAKNGSARHQFELEYGVTERWMTAIYGDFRKQPGQTFTYQGLKWENIYQLFEQGERMLDVGLYLEYFMPDSSLNKADAVEFKLLLEKELGRTIHSANLIFKKELGAKARQATSFGYAWSSRWRWQRWLEPGIELYGSLGELGNSRSLQQQSHQIGPVITGKLRNGLNYELGYLFGLTGSSDQGALKLVIGYEF